MLRRWKERIQHDTKKVSYALILATLLLGYFTGIFNLWLGIAILIAGIVLTLAWIAWITS